MKKIQTLAIVIAMLMPYCGFAQYDLKYLPCSNCSGNNTPVSFKIKYSTSDLTSDYGMRQGVGITPWHRGIDLAAGGYASPMGFHLLSPFNATIAQIYKNGNYLAIALDGPGDHNLGYGHIFKSGNLPIELGDMVFASVSNNGLPPYAIIDKTTGKAWSTVPGLTINYQGAVYITSNQVVAGDRIAPMGNSGINNVHVHVYRHVNPQGGVEDANNCKDPLKILNHLNSNLKLGMGQVYHLTTQNDLTYYAGDQPSSIQFACQMVGNSFVPENTSSYQQMMMAIDHVTFFAGPENALEAMTGWGTANSQFKMIKGPHYEGKVSQGSLMGTNISPQSMISGVYGNVTHTGIMPYCYSTGTYDNYFFADFYQRLHVNCQPGSAQPQFARCNAEAMYPDGKYRIHARAETIEGVKFGTNEQQSKVIFIDNFLPYIKRVKVRKLNSSADFYVGEWLWSNGSLTLSTPVNNASTGGSDLLVKVSTSEPLELISMTYDGYDSGPQTVCEPGSDGKEWSFVIPSSFLQSGTQFLHFEGIDQAGNHLQILNPGGVVPASAIPYRTGNTSWSSVVYCGTDKIHSITLGDLSAPIAAFTPQEITVSPGTYVNFFDASVGDIQQWEWTFQGTSFPQSTVQNPVVYYDTPGDYAVSLSVSSVLGSSTANGIVHVVEGNVEPQCNFSPQNITIEEGTTVYFSDLSTGPPTQWHWDFDGAAPPSFVSEPEVEYWQSGTYQVKLTVSNSVGVASCASTVTVVPQLPDLVMMCHATPFFGSTGMTCAFSADILFGTPPYQLSFNFGDGTVIPSTSNGGITSVSHQYLTAGIFELVLGVTDANGLYQTCYEGVTVIPANPCEGLSLALEADGSEYVAALEVGVPHVFSAPVNGGQPPYLYVWNFYPDPVSGAIPTMTVNYQQGPHVVTFPVPGNYKVKVMVNDFNGCVKTIIRNYAIFQPEHCMYAKIQKKHEGELIVPLGENCFYDFSEVLGSVDCADPPGSMDVPCITDSKWELRSQPGGSLLGVTFCHPYSQPGCTMGFVAERLFTWNFTEAGLYRLKLKIWDNDCNVQSGYDCEDQSEVQVRVVDCDNTVVVSPDVPMPQQGQESDVYGGTVVSGLGNDFILAGNLHMNWFATQEVRMNSESHYMVGCEFYAGIIDCPETFCGKAEERVVATEVLPELEVYPNPGSGIYAVRVKSGNETIQRIEVFSILGEKVKSQACLGEIATVIDISAEAPGFYLFKIYLDKGMILFKISKQ